MIIDKLITKIKKVNNPTAVGLDTSFDYLKDDVKKSCNSVKDAAKAMLDYNLEIIESVHSIVPAVKVQIAYYEMYGIEGLKTFEKTLKAAKKKGLVVIADAKRNDIGSTAGCYSSAFLGKVNINDKDFKAFNSDFLTVNGYLGVDGIQPFLQDCKNYDKGIFVLVKTSNPSSGQLQNKIFDNGKTLFESMGDLVSDWGSDFIGKYGYSSIGAVVGATHPQEAKEIRAKFPHTFFLIPGYGAQGGSADDLTVCFDNKGLGGIVNNSRGIICAYKSDKFKSDNVGNAAYNACVAMQEDIYNALKRAGKAK